MLNGGFAGRLARGFAGHLVFGTVAEAVLEVLETRHRVGGLVQHGRSTRANTTPYDRLQSLAERRPIH